MDASHKRRASPTDEVFSYLHSVDTPPRIVGTGNWQRTVATLASAARPCMPVGPHRGLKRRRGESTLRKLAWSVE